MTNHSREMHAITRRIEREFPELAEMAHRGSAPIVRVRCPRGHELGRVVLHEDYNGALFLGAVDADGELGATGTAERWNRLQPGSPFRQAATVCEEPGCPNDWPCDDHPTPSPLPAVSFVPDKIIVACPKCSYDGRVTGTHVLKLYVACAARNQRTMTLTV